MILYLYLHLYYTRIVCWLLELYLKRTSFLNWLHVLLARYAANDHGGWVKIVILINSHKPTNGRGERQKEPVFKWETDHIINNNFTFTSDGSIVLYWYCTDCTVYRYCSWQCSWCRTCRLSCTPLCSIHFSVIVLDNQYLCAIKFVKELCHGDCQILRLKNHAEGGRDTRNLKYI